MNWMGNPVFIVGHPKSGTSLVTALLDSHPQLIVLPEESDFYSVVNPYLKTLRYAWRSSKQDKVDLLVRKIIEGTHIKNLFRGKVTEDISGNLDYQDFDTEKFRFLLTNKLESQERFLSKDCLLSIVSAFRETKKGNDLRDDQLWLEKTPKHLWYIPEVLNDFPHARFIFIYRDPRDNYISYKKKHQNNLTPLAFAKSWNSSFQQIKNEKNDEVLFIKYENLVLNPIDEIKKIKSFLSIGWDPIMLEPTKNGKPWLGNSMFGGNMQAISNDSLGRFQQLIKEDDLITIEAFCSELMTKYGYPFHSKEGKRMAKRETLNAAYSAIKPFNSARVPIRRILNFIKVLIIGKIIKNRGK